jgi:hypothetical protein
MQSNHLPNLIQRVGTKLGRRATAVDDAQEDLSYDDALLDVEIRSFMRTEYGSLRPPDGIFPRVMYAIRLHRQQQAKAALQASKPLVERLLGRMGQALAGAYRYTARPAAGRMISGSLITALLVLAVWPGLARSLANGGQLPLTFDELLGATSAAPADTRPGPGAVESATSTSAAPAISTPVPAAPASSAPSAAPQSTYMSPGRLYEDPRLLLAQRTGEDPNQLKKHVIKPAIDGSGGNGSQQSDPEPGYNRPMTGQF